jgi:bifunctional UDP-N-acetylglucosamine pyrophosphorylase / glucosamine-1-phosphate N-acetyltransferase
MATHVLVLAAGKGTRMKSARPKVLHCVAGLPMIEHVLRAAAALDAASTTLVVGHQADHLRASLEKRPGLQFAVQVPQLVTAHAVQQAEPLLGRTEGTMVLLSGDVPQLRPATLTRLLKAHEDANAATTVLTAVVPRSTG